VKKERGREGPNIRIEKSIVERFTWSRGGEGVLKRAEGEEESRE
jgi:hypothetical protein